MRVTLIAAVCAVLLASCGGASSVRPTHKKVLTHSPSLESAIENSPVDCEVLSKDFVTLGHDMRTLGRHLSNQDDRMLVASDFNAIQQDVASAKTASAKAVAGAALAAASQVGNVASSVPGAATKFARAVNRMDSRARQVCRS